MVNFKFRALSGLVENWARAFTTGSGLGPFQLY